MFVFCESTKMIFYYDQLFSYYMFINVLIHSREYNICTYALYRHELLLSHQSIVLTTKKSDWYI